MLVITQHDCPDMFLHVMCYMPISLLCMPEREAKDGTWLSGCLQRTFLLCMSLREDKQIALSPRAASQRAAYQGICLKD